MANIEDPTPEMLRAYAAWLDERPANVRAVAERFLPWKLYRLKTSGHRVLVHGLSEHPDGTVTVTVIVSGEYNLVTIERKVFGIRPEELEACELPAADEPLGVFLNPDEQQEWILKMREKILKEMPS